MRPIVEPDPAWAALLARCDFPEPGSSATIALSGGPDSTGLLLLARAAGLDVTAVHVDHGLRDGSAADARWCEDLCDELGVAIRVESVEIDASADVEQRARRARLAVIGDAMTGHTMDDQAETVLLHLLRGSGPDGLAAMRPGARHPVLRLRRAELAAVCADAAVEPRLDPTNDETVFRRNRVRHELLPLIADLVDGDPVPGLARVADHQRQVSDHLHAAAADLDPTDTAALRSEPWLIAATALRTWLRDADGHPPSADELTRVRSVVELDHRATELSGGRRVSRRSGRLRLE